ncbi:hypothetical protein A5676_15460 [Mycobacterium malmoense]|uniref:LppU/SCO3897 family protein n=1 Tax=Mycobacterium malmoense TaxID=1780 RepID=UPI00080BCC09|nr:hypothetical protein [Mycobacterium malmoense]OCB38476.1 hypothetical protein A5676_15460 [Mycobacterium malmoense]
MTLGYLASDRPGLLAGELIFTFGLPATGLICLIAGLLERSRRRPPFPPPYTAGHPYPPPPPMGYPGPYPAPPPYPGYPPAVPPRRPTSKSATALITIGAVLLGLGGLNIFFHAARALSGHRGDSLLQVGDCISENDYRANRFDARPSSGCTDPAATYELAFKGDASASCPDGKREHSIYERASNHSTTLCFMINLQQGRCYLFISDGDAVSLRPGDCDNPNRIQVKVAQRIDGSTDKTQCPPGDKGVSYPEPARVYCLARADS